MKRYKKLTSLMLSAMMITSLLPVTAMAEEIETMPEADIVIEEQAEPVEAEIEAAIEVDEAEVATEEIAEEVAEEITEISATEENLEPVEIEIEEETAEVKAEVTSGECGTNLVWSFDDSTGVLTISLKEGATSGEMKGYSYSEDNRSPWYGFSSQIKSIVVNEGVTSIGYWAFYECSSFTSIELPSGLTEIKEGAFCKTSGLTSITIPEGVTRLGLKAFSQSGLTSIILPSSLTKLSGYVFNNCANLKSITLPAGIERMSLYDFAYCRKLESIILPEGLTYIGDNEFYCCESLTNITVPSGVTSIVGSAFSGCSSLTSIILPEGLTSLGNAVFCNCSSLTSVVLPEGVTSIGNYAFKNCSNLTNITLPSGLTSIGTEAFYGCKSLTDIYIDAADDSFLKNVLAEKNPGIYYNSEGKLKNKESGYEINIHYIKAIDECTIEEIPDQYYLGSALTPALTITNNGETLVEGTDYTVSYSDNNAVGTGVATITGIKAYKGTATRTFTIKDGRLEIPELPTLANVSNGVKITWTAVENAEKYIVYRRLSGEDWKKLGEVTETAYTDTTATKGKTYAYSISAANAVHESEINETGKSIRVLGAITPTLTNTSSGVSLKWTKAAGATGYYIYRKSGSGSFAKIKTITSVSTVSFTDTSVKANNGTKYTYAVKAYNGSYTSAVASKDIYRLVGKSISTLTNVATRKMVVKWTKDSKVTGYQIQYSKSSTFASGNTTSTITSNSTVSKTIGSLTKGSTYYVRMRTYKTASGVKYYSAWSAKKYVKIAK